MTSIEAGLAWIRDAVSERRKLLAAFRASWGKPGTKDGWLADRCFAFTRARDPTRVVDDKTWRDLEFPKIFGDMDSTVTPLGGQVLYRQLRTYIEDPAALADRYALCAALRSDRLLRENIQLRLAALRADSNADIAEYVFGPPPERPEHTGLILLWSLLSATSLIAVLAFAVSVLWWFAVVVINYVVIHVAAPRIDRGAEVLKGCARMVRTADRLSALRASRGPAAEILAAMVEEAPGRARARRSLVWFSASERSLVLGTLAMFLNAAFLAELVAYIRAVDRFARHRAQFATAYERVGTLDAAIALASFLERFPTHCQPDVLPSRTIVLEGGYHPLLARPVTNSISLEGSSALVAGSNMAGKTTFIKMVGTNLIFGRTIGFCLAERAQIPRSGVMASIHGEHSVESGKSHYFAEMEAVLSFLRSAERGDCTVFLIDELFSGTNTVERIAAARAVLGTLAANAQVLVTTHDVELQALLPVRFELYHFREAPDVEEFFDYKLRPGAATERNAIRLLRRMGFPESIVLDALTYAGESDTALSRRPEATQRGR